MLVVAPIGSSTGWSRNIPNGDRESLLGPFYGNRRVDFRVLFTAITNEDELGLWEVVEYIDDSLTFSTRRSRQETVKW